MRCAFAVFGSLVMLAAPLSIAVPAYAQQPGNSSIAAENEAAQVWEDECPERQELREERERICAEHEDIEEAHDRIKAQCMDAKGQERSECNEQKTALRARIDALHQRMKILQDRVAADPGCHHGHKGNAAKNQGPSHDEQSQSSTQSQSGR